MKWRDGITVIGVLAICAMQVIAANYEKTTMNPFTGKLDFTVNSKAIDGLSASIQSNISSASQQFARYSTNVSKSYVSNGRFHNNSTYTAAHIRALVDPHPAPGNNRNVAYNNAGSWGGASLLNYSGGRVGVGTTNPFAPFNIMKDWGANNFAAVTQLIASYDSLGDQPRLTFRAAQRGVLGNYSRTIAGNQLGNLNFRGHDGTGYVSSGQIAITAIAEETTTPTAQGARMQFNTILNGTTTGSTRLTIKNDGKVGIGTTTPRSVFDNASSTAGRARATIGSATNIVIADQNLGIRLKGNAVNWDDIIMPAAGLNVGGTPPTLISYNTGFASAYSFTNAGTISMFGWAEIPHSYKSSTDMDVHAHFSPISALTAGQTIRWTFRYDIIPMNSSTHTTGTVTGTYTVPVGGLAAWSHVYLDLGTIAGAGRNMGDNIGFEIVRVAGTVTTNVCLLTVGIHYQKDGFGSDTEHSKSDTP